MPLIFPRFYIEQGLLHVEWERFEEEVSRQIKKEDLLVEHPLPVGVELKLRGVWKCTDTPVDAAQFLARQAIRLWESMDSGEYAMTQEQRETMVHQGLCMIYFSFLMFYETGDKTVNPMPAAVAATAACIKTLAPQVPLFDVLAFTGLDSKEAYEAIGYEDGLEIHRHLRQLTQTEGQTT